MQPSIRDDHPLRRFLAGLAEDSFHCHLGLCDPQLVDYVVDLLIDFIHTDRLHPLCDARGRRLDQVVDMLTRSAADADTSETEHRRRVHQHVGDYTLFWSGVFPESLGKLRRVSKADGLIDYRATGKRSYAIASELSPPDGRPPARLLRRLSEEFEHCAYGLTLVRQGWERRDPEALGGPHPIW